MLLCRTTIELHTRGLVDVVNKTNFGTKISIVLVFEISANSYQHFLKDFYRKVIILEKNTMWHTLEQMFFDKASGCTSKYYNSWLKGIMSKI